LLFRRGPTRRPGKGAFVHCSVSRCFIAQISLTLQRIPGQIRGYLQKLQVIRPEEAILIRLRSATGFIFSAALFAQEYGGPSVLSRGLAPSVKDTSANVAFRPYLGINGICDTGLTPVSISTSGKVPNASECGVEGSVGVYGVQRWRHTQLGLNYSANYRHYAHNTYYDGTDQTLVLALTHQMSRRSRLTLREAAGLYPRNYLALSSVDILNPTALYAPNTELFDNRVMFLDTGADYTYQSSARLSFSFGGDASIIRRRSSSLFGVTTSSAHVDTVYRTTRNSSIGVVYRFVHYEFNKAFGASDIHSVGILYSLRLSKTWELSLMGGAARVETLSAQQVALDPVIAAITGQTAALVAAYRLNYIPDVSATLTKAFHLGNLSLGYTRGVSPGNGVYMTSQQETVSASATYTGVRHWYLSASGGYARMGALIQTLGHYRSYNGGGAVSRDLSKSLHSTLRFDGRRYDTGIATFKRDTWRVTLGLTWSPGDVPLRLW
jgi:hypothetical protein